MATGSDTKANLGPDWKALCALYAVGAADVEIATRLGITMKAFRAMEQENAQFANFVEKGRTLAMAWWVEQARTQLFNREFNTALFKINMANRFGWADKVEQADKNEEGTVNRDQLMAELGKAAKKLAGKYPELMRELGQKPDDEPDV